jgi:L-threonylcarbamoyladenylate synthase
LLDRYVGLLHNGEIVAFPTETVYGLGADAWNATAIQKVFDLRGRPADNPLIVHVSTIKEVEDFAAEISDDARKLMKKFWPGPLTLIFPKKPEVLDIITGGLDTVALRWPKHPLSQGLIARVGPLVAPSANSSGKPSPTKPEHVKEDFGDDFPIVEAGETEIGLESTVLDISGHPYQIYRPGAISAEEIEEVVNTKVIVTQSSKKGNAAKSPGTKYSHYSPEASVRWLKEDEDFSEPNALYLFHSGKIDRNDTNVINFKNDYKRLGHELYDRFRQADQKGYTEIVIEPFSEQQQERLIPALVNRIEKAVSK